MNTIKFKRIFANKNEKLVTNAPMIIMYAVCNTILLWIWKLEQCCGVLTLHYLRSKSCIVYVEKKCLKIHRKKN
jgi:hypothetical protein